MKLLARTEFHLDLEKIATQGAKVVLTVVLAWVGYLVLRRIIRVAADTARARVAEPAQRQRITTLLLLLNSVAKYVITFVAVIMVLDELKIDTRPALAAAGIVGLAVGFGAQHLVRDVVAGFFIIMEGQYSVGDLVEINGVFGRVEEVGLRITQIRDESGQLRHFPNGGITSTRNYTEKHIAYSVNIPLPEEGSSDVVPLVRGALDDFDREFGVFAEPAVMGPVEELPTYARVLRIEARTIPGRERIVEEKLAQRVVGALTRAGYSLPTGAEISLCVRWSGATRQS